jgi:hypothetical protein
MGAPDDAADVGEACGEMDMGLAAKASNLRWRGWSGND